MEKMEKLSVLIINKPFKDSPFLAGFPSTPKNRFWTGFFRLGGKNTLDDRAISRKRRCHGYFLSTKETDFQFILSCNYLIVQHHVEPIA